MKIIIQPVGLLLLASLSLLGCTAVAAVPSDQDSAGSEIRSIAHVIRNVQYKSCMTIIFTTHPMMFHDQLTDIIAIGGSYL